MSIPSNLYAEKVYSEQPQILWALDDQADYISLITEAQRDISDGWTLTNCAASTSSVDINQPFEDSVLNLLEGNVPVTSSLVIECVSENLINFTDMNNDLGTLSVGAYFYSNSAYLTQVQIGFEYTDTTTSQIIQRLETFNTTIFQSWSFISGTFEIPDENTDFRVVLKFAYTDGGGTSEQYQFYVNGITAGQWSEEFNAVSLGVTPTALPSNIALTVDSSVPADAYGLGGDSGYYIVSNNALVAKNSGIPMVFGASGVTRITPNTGGKPSLIVPGQGFLNELGKYKDYTVEFWIRINSNAYEPKRIFGPIASSDGIYVESGFLTLVIGKQFASHFVGEWFRPMLVHLKVIRNNASLLINGEEVINIPIETDSLILPSQLDNAGDSQDWLGFYAYEDVTPIEVDCVAIYPYSVSISVAKRRWVYGQGVLSPEVINSAYGGTQAFIDYPFADYTANYTYPDFAQWEQGTFDNLSTTNTALTTPEYSLPEIFIGSKTLQELYDNNQEIQVPNEDKFITFRPNISWDTEECYFNFPRLSILNTDIDTVYGVFSSDNLATEETLFKIYNRLTGNYFSVRKDLDEIHYYLYFNGEEEEIYTTDIIVADEKYAAGIQIEELVNFFGGNVASFFGNRNGLEMYVGGDETGTFQFTGKIYSVGLCTAYNANAITSHFEENGTAILDSYLATGSAESANALALLAHTASYTLLPSEAYDTYFLDIGVSGYWEDYLPLSYFAQSVTNELGNQYYDLDFLQFNLGYPSPTKLTEYEEIGSWTYNELKEEYAHPVQKTYFQLDNSLLTGWNNYEDMSQKAAKYFEYDTTDAVVRSYITLQYIEEGANTPITDFPNYVPPKENKIINIDEYSNWLTTKFEVVDNTLIYPTKTVDFSKLAVVYHLDFNIRGILRKPIRLRRLELTSQAFNENAFNPIGTRFGVNMFPYKRAGLYFDYKSQNPFSIYKGSTPYLYLNRTSGIEVRGDFDPLISRGIAIPVNSTLADNYRVSATQIWMRSDLDQFPFIPTEIFEIVYKADTIKFYITADNPDGTRARVYAKSLATGQTFNGLSYFLNGSLVREPVLTIKEWAVIGIAFSTALNFDSFIGGINLTGPLVFNNIAFYQANNLQQVQSTLTRPWLKVKTDGVTNFEWEYWLNSFTWDGVLVISASDLYGVSPSDVYKTYVGTNKIIIDDDEGMIFDAQKVKIYNDTTWTVRLGSAV
jgi:hypothetical protein